MVTERLKECIIKGFTMNDEQLKNPNNIFGKDYFEEQHARILGLNNWPTHTSRFDFSAH